jgi:hypothetical protein
VTAKRTPCCIRNLAALQRGNEIRAARSALYVRRPHMPVPRKHRLRPTRDPLLQRVKDEDRPVRDQHRKEQHSEQAHQPEQRRVAPVFPVVRNQGHRRSRRVAYSRSWGFGGEFHIRRWRAHKRRHHRLCPARTCRSGVPVCARDSPQSPHPRSNVLPLRPLSMVSDARSRTTYLSIFRLSPIAGPRTPPSGRLTTVPFAWNDRHLRNTTVQLL